MCDILCIHQRRFCTHLQRLKHRQYTKNTIKIPPPKPEKGGGKRKKLKKIGKSGGQSLTKPRTEDGYEM